LEKLRRNRRLHLATLGRRTRGRQSIKYFRFTQRAENAKERSNLARQELSRSQAETTIDQQKNVERLDKSMAEQSNAPSASTTTPTPAPQRPIIQPSASTSPIAPSNRSSPTADTSNVLKFLESKRGEVLNDTDLNLCKQLLTSSTPAASKLQIEPQGLYAAPYVHVHPPNTVVQERGGKLNEQYKDFAVKD
jgi:hypothetical protein